MMEIKTLERHHLALLAACYGHTKFLYGNRLQKGSRWVLRRAKKWICKRYAKVIDQMPEGVRGYFAPEASEQELFDFLAECYAENSQRAVECFELQKEILQPLGDAVVRMVQDLQDKWDEDGEVPGVSIEGERVILLGVDSSAFERRLILENATLSQEVAERGCLMNIDEVKQKNGWYIFYEAEDFLQREAVRFTNAYVQVRCVDCTRELFFAMGAWMRLHQFAYAIVEKSELPGDYCNEREKALLPLLREIKQFGFLTEYPLLTELAEQTGCRSAAFDKRLEKAKLKKNGLWNSGLDRAEFEPLLRIIYEKIQQSQEDYPSQVELHCDAQDMDRKRREITDFFHSQGFAGEYPDFYKTADIPGYHMVSGNHGNVLYCRVKNAQMFIHCAEGRAWNRELLVHFHCGRALTGKRQSVQDIFSCCCQDRGYRWSEWVWGHSSDRALEGAKIAVKKLQLDKLTKEERKRYGTYNNGMDKGVLIAFAVSAFSLPVAMLLTAIVMAISGEWEALVEMRTELIRWEIFTFYATIYGLPLGVFALLARRR